MSSGETIVSGGGERYAVKAVGRATFECVAPLRALAKELDTAEFKQVDVDLADCQGMDSTYMGVLAMIALRAKKINASVSIYNASELAKTQLFGLGLKKLFRFTEGTVEMGAQTAPAAEAPVDKITHATTVLEAHKTLMDVDQENVEKFEKVVDFVQKDLDKLNEKSE
ncbi:MAG: STAS domain-containing protein [Lentisphaeria bacterium]|nr:STAS domain-containing protein [Lentisphaeria bacterium]